MVNVTFRKLRIANVVVGLFQLFTSAVIFALGPYNAKGELPIYTFFIENWSRDNNAGQGFYTPLPDRLGSIPISVWSGIFLLLSGIDHLLVSMPGVNKVYNRLLCRNRNPFRWAEYSVSASIMGIMIGQLCGITSIFELAALFGLMSTVMLFGWQMEVLNGDRLTTYAYTDDTRTEPLPKAEAGPKVGRGSDTENGLQFVTDARDSLPVAPGASTEGPSSVRPSLAATPAKQRIDWSPFIMGCWPFLVWIVITWYYFFYAAVNGSPPAFVYSIVFILTGLYSTFALVQVLQFKQVRGFRGFARAEIWYIVLSLTSKQLLAWLNYGGSQRFQNEG